MTGELGDRDQRLVTAGNDMTGVIAELRTATGGS
jgi:hypothetical protein